jgi:hypothetical protein
VNWRARSAGGIAAAIVLVVALGACSADSDEPGGTPPTLYEPTQIIDPTPTTQP